MTSAIINQFLQGMNTDKYHLICDNGLILKNSKDYPIGYGKDSANNDMLCQVLPSTLLNESRAGNNDADCEKNFNVLMTDVSNVQYIKIFSTEKDSTKVFDTLKTSGFYSADQIKAFVNNPELFGRRARQ
jgi:uncharacterized protein YwgA